MEIYRYTTKDGWTLAMGPRLPETVTDGEDLGAWLFEKGYKQLAQSGVGRCYVGHFYLWHKETPDVHPLAPPYAIEIDQVGTDALVWIETLPDLWEFLRLYSGIGVSMARRLPGEEEDLEEDDETMYDDPTCPDCGKPMTFGADNDHEWDA